MGAPVKPIDFERELNPEQAAAAQAPDGPVLVIAAAGTGKTRTLIYRVAYLIQEGVFADRILLVTFTNRAAQEMLDRARELVGPMVGGMWGGTFHSVCNRILRQYAELIGYKPRFTIMDQDDSRSVMKSVLNELKVDDAAFPKPDVILSLISYALNTAGSLAVLVQDRFHNHPINTDDLLRVAARYMERKLELNAMDFDDLLIQCLRLFEEHPDVCAIYQNRFQHIMVDEYQDTNTIQARLVDLLAARHRNLLVVGDDFQSIYSWRGANFKNIMEFPKRYENARVVKLETNYRSVPEILDVANKCIAGNPEQFQKTLRAVRESFKKPHVAELRDGNVQARYVLDKVQEMKREGYKLKDICILYRSHFHSMEIQMELNRQHLPYVITSGVRFFEQAHVKDVCTLLRLVNTPTDELAFIRLACLLPRVGQKTAEKMWRKIGKKLDLSDFFARQELMDTMPKDARPLWQPIDELLECVTTEKLAADPAEIVHRFLDAFYDKYATDTFENYINRIEDIQELAAFTGQFDDLEAFLSEMALLTNVDTSSAASSEDVDAIRLSTVHQAKGLEWKVVFAIWLADGMFPSGRSLDEEDGEAEERRLFYVTTTRAEDELYLCVPQMRRQRDGGTVYYSTSRFVREIPPEFLQREHVGYY